MPLASWMEEEAASLLSSCTLIWTGFKLSEIQSKGLLIWINLLNLFLLLDTFLGAAEHRLLALAMTRSLSLLDHPSVLFFLLFNLMLLLRIISLSFPFKSLCSLNSLHLCVILSSPASHITNVLDHKAFNLVQQLQRRLTLNLATSNPVHCVNSLDLLPECIEHFWEIKRATSLTAFTTSRAIFAWLVDHGLLSLFLQCGKNHIVNLEL